MIFAVSRKPFLFLAAGFCLGLAIAFAIHFRMERAKAIAAQEEKEKITNFLELWKLTDSDPEKRNAMLPGLSSEEIEAVFNELHKKIGPMNDLDGSDKELLGKLACIWIGKDPKSALAWLKKQTEFDQKQLFPNLLLEVQNKDLASALDLMRMFQTWETHKEQFDISATLLQNVAALGEDPLIELCRLGLYPDTLSSGFDISYPIGFDFRRVIDDLVALAADPHHAGLRFRFLPNLMGEWAKKDPQGAWEWLQQGNSLVFNGKREFFSGIIHNTTAKQTGQILGNYFNPSNPLSGNCYDVGEVLRDRPSEELLESFLQSAPHERAELLNGLFEHFSTWVVPDATKVRKMLFDRMKPEQQAEIRKCYEKREHLIEEMDLWLGEAK